MSDQTTDESLAEVIIDITDAGPASKKLSIEIPAERIAAKLEESFDSLQAEAQIPGFRRGRAPMRLLEKRFGKDIRQEACHQLVGEAYSHAVEKHELRVLGEPDIKDVDDLALPDEGPLKLEVQVEVAPEVELPDLKGIELKRPTFEVADGQIDSEVDRYREMYGRMVTATDKVREQDYLGADVHILDAEGEVLEHEHGVNVFVPGKTPNDYKGVVAGILVDDLGRKLAGAAIGDDVDLAATGPKQHENEKLRDRELTLRVSIRAIQRAEPLTVEQLVETAGFESEAELRDHFRDMLEQRAQVEQRRALADQVTDTLLEKVDIELPERLSARQAQQVLQRRAIDLMSRGASEQDIEQHLAELRAASEQDAARQLKLLFILDEVARNLNVEVSEEQVNGRIAMIAAQQGQRPEKLRQTMAREGQLDQLFVQLREEAAIARLIDEATIKDVSEAEWRKLRGEEAPAKPASKKKSSKKKTSSKKTADAADEGEAPAKKKSSKKKSTKKKASGD